MEGGRIGGAQSGKETRTRAGRKGEYELRRVGRRPGGVQGEREIGGAQSGKETRRCAGREGGIGGAQSGRETRRCAGREGE